MPVLGHAIASYLSGLKGQYSVELPSLLVDEMEDVVSECNKRTNTGNHALLVTNETPLVRNITTISWGEILKWRTDDDRIFVWARGIKEPDTSFRSVVRPFISSHFPGDNGGECTIELLAQLSVEELWRRRNLPFDGDSFRAFYETFKWIAGVLLCSFEQVGSTSEMHWSDQFLLHWSEVLKYLDQGLANMGTAPVARHAWEIVRAAGFPVPSIIAGSGNPFIEPPKDLEGKHWNKIAKDWQKTVDEFLRTEGNVAVFLTALDAQVPGAGNVSPWRGLGWQTISNLPGDVASPILGKAFFTAPASPSILSPGVPNYIAAPVPSWWGVTDGDIQKAVDQLHNAIELRPSVTCNALVPVFSGIAASYLLETQNGAVTYTSTQRKWSAQVSFTDLQVEYRGKWERLIISPVQPTIAQESDAWINPDNVSLDFKSSALKITHKPVSSAPGFRLAIPFDLAINYAATIDMSTGNADGSWNPLRSLSLKARVSYYMNGAWTASQPLESMAKVIVPSPFSPSIMVAVGNKVLPSPDKEEVFLANLSIDDRWQPESTPDILLPEEGSYEVKVYQGSLEPRSPRFASTPLLQVNGVVLPTEATSTASCSLDSGDIIVADESNRTYDIAVIKVKERSGALSSGLLSAVRDLPARKGRPSSQARGSILGRYQDKVTRALCNLSNNIPDSLYQYVISSAEAVPEWPWHSGTPSPNYLFDTRGLTLPGIGNGPGPALTGCPEWTAFMKALADICSAIGLKPGAEESWLSGIDPSVIATSAVKRYTDAQRDLVQAAKAISPADTFWATYPFSIVVIEGKLGASFGQLLAVLLSPLHPARLNWAFSVAFTARRTAHHTKMDRSLLGLAEGWNIPYTGQSVNAAGQPIPLVAIPTDPGPEQDFATWSALAVLEHSGLADLPDAAAGLPLPWGGRTGINDKVVERAITDYLDTYPHLNSLEVDVRAVSPAPRSQEIDDAILRFVGTRTLPGVDKLGGSTRVWDSSYRLGDPPTRDNLFIARKESESGGPFEWKIYDPSTVPTEADIAFIENSSVNLAITRGATKGIIGALPLRRFCPSTLVNLMFDQNYAASPGDDLLGLSSLLAVIEYHGGEAFPVLRAIPQINGLGIGMGARWEVLGAFNLDPSLLSSVVATGTQTSGKRLLWEWRPSWLVQGRANQDELAQRPYYVIARVPVSLLKALEYRQGLTEEQGLEMLTELGYRGIGLASLQAAGGTQESAAAGFFYALRLLLPSTGHPAPATWTTNNAMAISTVLPVDTITSLLAGLAGQELRRRADLLIVQIARPANGSTRVCVVPVEVKHHGRVGYPEHIQANNQELQRAREQLTSTVDVIEKIAEAIHPRSGVPPDPFGNYTRYVGLATLLDLAMSLAPVLPDVHTRAEILRAVLNGQVEIGVGDPVLLWFAPGSLGINGAACLVDPYRPVILPSGRSTRELFIDPAATPGLWWKGQPIRADDQLTRDCIDSVMRASTLSCTSLSRGLPASNIYASLAQALGLDASPARQEGKDSIPVLPGEQNLSDVRPTEIIAPSASDTARSREPVGEFIGQLGALTIRHDLESPAVPSENETLHRVTNDTSEESKELHIENSEQVSLEAPRVFLGWTTTTSRWTLVGKLAGTNDNVGLDLDHPKAMGVFGYMGSGKSYLLGTLIEGTVERIPSINQLSVPLAVVVFNYRRNASDRFELASLKVPNQDEADMMRLATSYGATPQLVHNVHVLALPGELVPTRLQEYGSLPASELFFNPATLSVEDWELLMGEPGSEAVFARTIRHALVELRSSGKITLEQLEDRVLRMLVKQSRSAAQLRFDFIRRYLSSAHNVDFERVLQPGRVVIVDLRQPLFNKDDALRFFLVCANQVSQVQGRFNKLIIFDEAHEYLSDEFGEKIEARIRQMRHEGTSYIFATQDVRSIPLAIRRFITTRFVFSLGTHENVDDLTRFAPEFKGQQLLGMQPGYCLAQANQSIDKVFERPRLVQVRPRVTQHGGASRIFS